MPSTPVKSLQFDDTMPIGMEIIPVDQTYVHASDNLLLPHRASFYCILHFQEGRPVHQVDFVPVNIYPGSYLFVGKNRVQLFDQEQPFKARILLFTADFFCSHAADTRFLNRTPLFNTFDEARQCLLKSTGQLDETWQLLEQEAQLPSDNYTSLLLKNHLANFLLQAEREISKTVKRSAAGSSQEETFYQFRELIEAHFKAQKSLSFYTAQLGLSAKVIARATERITGKTPKQLLDERLLLEAKRLLIHDTEAGKAIGYLLGFTEPTNFIKFFRRHTGFTPAAFRGHYRPGSGQ